MEKILEQSARGQARKRKAEENENEWLAEQLRKNVEEEEKQCPKRKFDDDEAANGKKIMKQETV